MSYTNGLDKPTDYFNTVLYTGNGNVGHAITGVGFQPDWVWLKERSSTSNHQSGDAVRGATKYIQPNTTDGELTDSNRFSSFDSDGFTQGANNGVNESGQTYVAWNWLGANGTASNTDGSITSTVSANTTSGFSIVSYDGEGSAGDTVGHGLGAIPKMMIFKRLESADSWSVYHSSVGATKRLRLNTTDATQTSSSFFNDTEPTSSFFTLGANSEVNGSAEGYIAYCFAEKKGFSKFGSYTGNGNADGTFVYTGFKPAWILYKRASDGTNNWGLIDNKRDPINPCLRAIATNLNNAESPSSPDGSGDMLSNGWKIKASAGSRNASGVTYIYMAFAENPFVTSTGIPTCAR